MSTIPLPPFLPENETSFAEHVTSNVHDWYEYCRQVYEYTSAMPATLADARAQTQEAAERSEQTKLRIQALEIEIRESSREHLAVRNYQKEEIKELQTQLAAALVERQRAIDLATPTVRTTLPTPMLQTPTEGNAAAAARTPPSTIDTSSNPGQLSEKLPNPDKFTGDRKDLRRFVSQIHEKMKVNRDRFPTPQSRMSYVSSRLGGNPYSQILPYIIEGVCQLPDYKAILEKLDHAYGDPNRVHNARSALFRLQQTNKDFSTFYAEFQRLALEGQMLEDSLPTILEHALSKELKLMLLHNVPPTREIHSFAAFLQELENRRKQYEGSTTMAPRIYANAAKSHQETPAPVRTQAARPQSPPRASSGARITEASGDAMDLSRGRSTRHERKECYRCGSEKHFIRDCPQPDNRSIRSRPVYENASSRSPSPPSTEYGTRMLLRPASPLSSASTKGASLT
jgi:hypothetical protein